MNKYNIGDIVRIKENAYEIKGTVAFVENMKYLLGQEYKVISVNKRDYSYVYFLEGCINPSGNEWYIDELWLEDPGPQIEIDEIKIMNIFM